MIGQVILDKPEEKESRELVHIWSKKVGNTPSMLEHHVALSMTGMKNQECIAGTKLIVSPFVRSRILRLKS